MLTIRSAQGVIFDVDETLLDNSEDAPTTGIHNRARFLAIQEVGRLHDISPLASLTLEENYQGFADAPIHSPEGAIWHTLFIKGVVTTKAIDSTYPLLQEILAKKDSAYVALLRTEGKPFPGAVEFVHWLAECGLKNHLAIASTAKRRDIDIFLEMTDLTRFFQDSHIISRDTITHPKPHPEAFDKAFRSLDLPDHARSHVIAFEDNPRGIASAKGAGLFTCAITNAQSREKLEALPIAPDLVADSFDAFRQLLDPLPA